MVDLYDARVRRILPSLDQIARALLVHGARDAAVDLMEAVVARGGEEKPRCDALLQAVRARPTDRVSGPPIALDAGLVEALAAQGRLIEAWAVTRGAKVAHTVAGVEIAQALSLVMEPGGLDEPWLTRWTTIVVSGSTADIAAIEREVIAGHPVPPAMLERMRVAWRLLKGFWSSAANDTSPAGGMEPELRMRVAAKITARDLDGALVLLRGAAESSGAALPVAMALARLLSAAERAMNEEAPRGTSTVPLAGAGLALLQLRMGNFQDAERLLRKLVVETPADHLARDRLADVLVLRRALDGAAVEEDVEPLELAKTPAPDWLNKRGRRASVEGWAVAQKPAAPRGGSTSWDEEGEDSTSVIRPDEEAELHVKTGHPERAVRIYELLVQRYPDKPRFGARLAELQAMIAAARVPEPAAPEVNDTEPPPPNDGGEFVLEGPTSVERWRAPSPAKSVTAAAVVVVPIRPIVRIR